MDKDDAGRKPRMTEKTKADAELRAERRAEALRANLLRRKAQARARQDKPEDDDPTNGV